MQQQKAAQVGAVAQAFLNTEEKGFEVGAQRMAVRAAAGGLAGQPASNDGPIKEGKELPVVGHQQVSVEQSCMVAWSKCIEEGIIAANSFCEVNWL